MVDTCLIDFALMYLRFIFITFKTLNGLSSTVSMFAQHLEFVNKLLTVSRPLFLQCIHQCLGHSLPSVMLRLLCRRLQICQCCQLVSRNEIFNIRHMFKDFTVPALSKFLLIISYQPSYSQQASNKKDQP